MAGTSTLPLHGDGSTRFLPWLIALMVFLAALSTVAAFALDSALERWDGGLRGTLTVQLPRPSTGLPIAPQTLQATLEFLRTVPGVVSATALDPVAEAALLQPWLGSGFDALQLPLPVLLDLHLAPDADLDPVQLTRRLGAFVAGATVETHGAWLDRLFRVAALIELGAAGVVVVIASVAVVTVVFTTRTGLMIHAPIVDLLHLIGAADDHVARQFQWHAFRLGVRGGAIGLVLALLAFGALRLVAEQGALSSPDLMPGFRIPVAAWILVSLLPVGMGFVGLLTARVTVLRALARIP
jgi:cell division transport system permease protein